MIIFLYGPDGYRLKQNGSIVMENYRKKHPNGVFFKFDLSTVGEIEKVEDAVKSGSLFGEVRLIVLKNVFSDRASSDRVGELIKTQNILKEKDIVLVIIENQNGKELSKNKSLFSLLNGKDNMVRNVEYLEGANLTKWIKGEFVSRNCSIEQDATRELIAIAGNESWSLVNEINKLCNFKMGGVVKKEDITLLGFKKIDLNIFDFVDSVAGKNKARAYEILFKEIKSGRDPYYLLSMVIYGFRTMLTVKDLADRGMSLDSIVKKARLNPFVARKTYQSASKFSLVEIKNIYGHLLDMDTRSKEGAINLTDSLFSFVLV
ncbi:MAG: polymerase III, delta subunit protein [Candidatus Yanofskybacteria bacterium GW2011_GWA1_39_13]|uniref:DNA polymerase III subunit delta n=1 Tax=Yanofskybacteria sp. (strain GW2011_GWA1_39_13) TaxID=1619019 RepID=A0A0G0MHP4_YANXG|nr:MAG: polymerase III, delta subunit protein [Candidatus Yanofskybacteria bacterium GW2011_GWA1_39_13]